MADENRVVAHRPQALRDAGDQLSRSPPGKSVRPMLPATARRRRRRAWPRRNGRRHGWAYGLAVTHAHLAVAELQQVSVMQPARRREVAGRREAELSACIGRPSIQYWSPSCGPMMAGPGARPAGGAAGMVDVRVSQIWPSLRPSRSTRPARDRGRRPDRSRRLQGLVAPDERAVLLEGRDGNREALQHAPHCGQARLQVGRGDHLAQVGQSGDHLRCRPGAGCSCRRRARTAGSRRPRRADGSGAGYRR